MTPTLQLFTRALLTPDLSFKTLADARAAPGADPFCFCSALRRCNHRKNMV